MQCTAEIHIYGGTVLVNLHVSPKIKVDNRNNSMTLAQFSESDQAAWDLKSFWHNGIVSKSKRLLMVLDGDGWLQLV